MTTFKNSHLKGSPKALVVGGSGGIGRSVCLALAAAGVKLIIHGKSMAKLTDIANELPLPAPELIEADLATGSIPPILKEAAKGCDILVVAYGPFLYKNLAQTSPEEWQWLALANLALPGSLVSVAAPAMADRGFGRIMLFGGTKTDLPRGFRMNAAYASAKTGLGVIARSVAAEYAGSNVACAVVCPGMVDTEYLDSRTKEKFAQLTPSGQLTNPDRLADFVVRLLIEIGRASWRERV